VPAVLAGWIFAAIAAESHDVAFSILSDSVDYGEWKTGFARQAC